MHDRVKGLIAINIAAVIFGSAALYGKLDVSPVWIVAMRGIFASGTLLSVGLVRKDIVSSVAGFALTTCYYRYYPFTSLAYIFLIPFNSPVWQLPL